MDRLEQLAQLLAHDEAAAKELLAMSAEAASAKLNEMGYDFTAEELKLFADKLDILTATAEAELDEDALDAVSGGGLIGLALALATLRGMGPIMPIRWR